MAFKMKQVGRRRHSAASVVRSLDHMDPQSRYARSYGRVRTSRGRLTNSFNAKHPRNRAGRFRRK